MFIVSTSPKYGNWDPNCSIYAVGGVEIHRATPGQESTHVAVERWKCLVFFWYIMILIMTYPDILYRYDILIIWYIVIIIDNPNYTQYVYVM
jgi:hypothetical protein